MTIFLYSERNASIDWKDRVSEIKLLNTRILRKWSFSNHLSLSWILPPRSPLLSNTRKWHSLILSSVQIFIVNAESFNCFPLVSSNVILDNDWKNSSSGNLTTMKMSIIFNSLWSVDLVRIISDDFSYSVKWDHRMIDMKERSIVISSQVDFSIQPKSERLILKISTTGAHKPEQNDEGARVRSTVFSIERSDTDILLNDLNFKSQLIAEVQRWEGQLMESKRSLLGKWIDDVDETRLFFLLIFIRISLFSSTWTRVIVP